MRFYLYICISAAALLSPLGVLAASLSVTPPTLSVHAGDTFTVSVRVSSAQAVNAISGTLSFPPALLEALGTSKDGSVLSLWVEDPSRSNSAGTVTWSGVVPNPGFTGTGKVLSVVFRAKTTGAATVRVTSGQVLANDGNGTDVLDSTPGETVTITPTAPAFVPETPAPAKETPAQTEPASTSPTIEVVPVPAVSATPWWDMLPTEAVGTLVAILLVVFGAGLAIGWHRHALSALHLRKKVKRFEWSVYKSFDSFKGDIVAQREQADALAKHEGMPADQRAILKKLKATLDHSAKFVEDTLEDVLKESKDRH